jgi:PilZ domain
MGNSGTALSKVTARLASIGLDQAGNSFLQDCFKQFGVQVVATQGEPSEIFNRQKYEACVLRIYAPNAEQVLSAARNSSSNRRMVIYGIARNTQEALKFSSYGINAVFDEPLERQSVLKVVRATHLLVIHELRRYVRIPVVMEVAIETGGTKNLVAASMEVSAGGMSVRCASPVPSDTVRLVFTLPSAKITRVRAQVCWSRQKEQLYGFRFDSTDEARLAVRRWIEQYLEAA